MRPRRAVQPAWAAFAVAVAVVGAAVTLGVVNVAAGSARPDEFGLAYALIALTYGLVGLIVVRVVLGEVPDGGRADDGGRYGRRWAGMTGELCEATARSGSGGDGGGCCSRPGGRRERGERC
jgi:hypothetical protein